MPKLELTLKNKKIMYLKSKEGDYKLKKGNDTLKKMEETNELHHGKLQTFTIDLGNCGREKLGFIKVEYGGEMPLEENKYIDKATFYLKQKKGTTKDPRTFIEKKMSEVILIMTDINFLRDEDKVAKYEKNKNLTPDESIALAIEEYGKDKSESELVDVNEELKPLKDEIL